MPITLDEAVERSRTGDIWLFRGRSGPDRAIQFATNSPVNHVGMSVVLEDLPPLMWHAELGKALPDRWTGTNHRGVQLHDLRDAVRVWGERYGQRAWLRELQQPVTREMEDAMLRTVARLDGTPFPSTSKLAWRWARGRVPQLRLPWSASDIQQQRGGQTADEATLEVAYCAEVVAVTYESMGLLPAGKRVNWYDPGRFWSGDELNLAQGYRLGDEVAVDVKTSAG